jgi:hypothetical protein
MRGIVSGAAGELPCVRDLMRHRNPNGDLELVFADAIAAFVGTSGI